MLPNTCQTRNPLKIDKPALHWFITSNYDISNLISHQWWLYIKLKWFGIKEILKMYSNNTVKFRDFTNLITCRKLLTWFWFQLLISHLHIITILNLYIWSLKSSEHYRYFFSLCKMFNLKSFFYDTVVFLLVTDNEIIDKP